MFDTFLLLSLISVVTTLGFWATGTYVWIGPPAIATFSFLAMYLRRKEATQGYSFTLWVFAFVTASLFYP